MSARQILNFVTASVFILSGLALTTELNASEGPNGKVVQYFKAPLRFEPNQGQSVPGIDFVSHGRGYVLHLTANEAVFALPHEQLSMRLVGSNDAAQPTSMEPLQSKVNYFVGNDPFKWRTGIPTYGKAKYPNVYSGIDVVYYGNGEALEYDFVLVPGADPGQIALDFPGSRRIRTNGAGDLLIDGEYGTLRFNKPVVYQEADGRRHKIDGKFAVSADQVHFKVGKFDHARPLIIDPSLVFSIYLGGTLGLDTTTAIAADSDSTLNGPHAYVTGYTTSSDFPTLNGYQNTLTGNTDAFLTKLDSKGTVLYSTFFGGTNSSNTAGLGIAIDASRNIYITGRTDANDLPLRGTVVQSTRLGPSGHTNAFVAEFSAAGGLLDSTYLGGSDNNVQGCMTGDQGNSITVGANGNLYVAGFTDSADFPGTHPAPRCRDAFVLGLNLNRTQPTLFSELIPDESLDYAGNGSYNSGNSVALDTTATLCKPTDPAPQINVYATGYVANGGAGDPGDVFVAKFDPTGAPCYKTVVGGLLFDAGNAIAVDKTGNAYVAGSTASSTFPVTPTALQPAFGGGRRPGDGLLLKLGPTGSVLYASYLGGSSFDQATGIALDTDGNVSVAGSTSSSNFPVKNTFYPYAGGSDVFVAHFDPTMTFEYYSTFIGGLSDDFGIGLATAQLANSTTNYTFVGGYTNSTDFPKTIGRSATNQTGFVTLIGETNISKLAIVGAAPLKAAVGVAIPSVQVQVQDANGVPVADATNAVTIALGSNPANGTLSGTTTVNAVGGIATFSGLSIDKPGVGYAFVANTTSPAMTTAPSAPFNVYQSVLVFTAQPVNTMVGAAIPAVKVAVQDGSGNTLTSATNAVTLAIGANPGGGTLAGTTTVNAVAGVATFNGLTINKGGNGYTLVASSSGAASVTSATFNITQPVLAFTTQPVNTTVGNFIPPVSVAVRDSLGNLLTTAATTVTMAIGTNAGGGTLTGTLAVPTVNGIATFSDLRIDKAADGYTLVASATGALSATSAPFNITSQTNFANFSCDKIDGLGSQDDNEAHFHLNCDFTLGPGSNDIQPATTDAFNLIVGPATISLPAGSFRSDGNGKPGPFRFQSQDNKGMELEIHIEPKADLKKGPTYHLEVEAEGMNFGSIPKGTETVTATLTIGNNTGTTSVNVNAN